MTQGQVTQLAEVFFAQPKAVYDVTPARFVTDGDDNPLMVHREAIGLSTTFQDRAMVTDDGTPTRYDTRMSGIYRGYHATLLGDFERVFARKRSVPLHDKFVYVFGSDDRDGAYAFLEQELYFQEGSFGLVDLEGHAGQDRRPHGEVRHDRLSLPVFRAGRGQLYHFFVMSPIQLPWAAVERLAGSILSRGARLFDEFCTDAMSLGDDAERWNMWEAQQANLAGRKLGYLVYLVDPMEEAQRRHQAFSSALDRWVAEQERLRDDREYLLAKRIDGMVGDNGDLRQHVINDLGSYLRESETKSRRLRAAAELAAQDLLRWIGLEATQSSVVIPDTGSSRTWYFDGVRSHPSQAPTSKRIAINPYSDLVRDFREFGDDESYDYIGLIAASVVDRINETSIGLRWVEWVFDGHVQGKKLRADGGSRWLFESFRRSAGASARILGLYFMAFGPQWVRVHGDAAAKNVQTWAKTVHGIDLAEMKSGRKKYVRQLKKEMNLAKKSDFKGLGFTPAEEVRFKKFQAGFRVFQLGIELFNLAMACQRLKKEKDPMAISRLIGSVAATGATVADLSSMVKPEFKVTVAGTPRVVKLARVGVWATLICQSIVTGMALTQTVNATNVGQAVGHGMRVVGGILAIGGTATGKFGGVVVAMVGFAMQSIGSWVVSNFSSAALFLQYCRWGEPTGVANLLTSISDSNRFYLAGKLEDMRDNIEGQHQALDELFYDYQPEIIWDDLESVMTGSGDSLYVKAGLPPTVLPPVAKWSVKVVIKRHDMGYHTVRPVVLQYNSDHEEHFDPEAFTVNQPLFITSFLDDEEREPDPLKRTEGNLTIRADFMLDVLGDGDRVISRRLEDTKFFSLKLPINTRSDSRRRAGGS